MLDGILDSAIGHARFVARYGAYSAVRSIEDLNPLGGFIGAMAQSNFDDPADVAPAVTDFRAATKFRARVAEPTKRWTDGQPD
jgi:NAD(P)H dehydrogenase (quinone)